MNIHELQTLKVDLKDNYIVEAVCKQLDDIILNFEIYNNCVPMELNNFNVELRALKEDNIPLIQDTDITMSNNMIKIKCNPQLTTSSGIVKAELQFIDKITKQKKSSFNIEIDVKSSILEVNRSISIPTFTAMERLEKDLDKVRDLEFNFNEADKLNRELKNTTIPTGNTLKTNLDNSISTGTTLKNDIDNRITTGNKLKTDLDNSSTVATSKKEILDTANVQAEKNIETLNSFGDASQLTKDVTTLKTKVLENTLTSIETDSTLTKLDNCENSFVHNMQIKGRTLQNVCIGKDFTIEKLPTSNFIQVNKELSFTLSPNKTYTILFNIENQGTGKGFSSISLGKSDGDEWSFRIYNSNSDNIKNGNYIKTFEVPSNFKDTLNGNLKFIFEGDCNGKITIKNIMLLEGDYTNKEIPSYFEGIKSVGEAEGNKISILNCGKNLVDINKAKLKTSTTMIKNTNSFILNGNGTWSGTEQKIKLYPEKQYTLKATFNKIQGGSQSFVQIRDLNVGKDYCVIRNTGSQTFTIPSTASDNIFLYFAVNGATQENSIVEFIEVQLEEGTTATTYEPYKEDKTEILAGAEPLKGLPNGVSDAINYDRNEITRNVVKIAFDGSENWVTYDELTNSNRFTLPINQIPNCTTNANIYTIDNIVNNKFINTAVDDIVNKETEAIGLTGSGLSIRLKKSKANDVSEFKNLLKTWSDARTPLEMYCQLANPVIEKLNIKDELQTFKDGYIQLDNAITPFTSLEYSTNIPSAIGGLTQITDKLVDDVTNVEITISDMDAEIGEARKGKTTLNERLEEDKTNILKTIGQVKDMSMNVKTDSNYEGYDVTKIYTWTKTGTYLTEREGVIDLPSGWNQGRYEVITFDVSNSEYSGQIIFGDPYNKKMAFRYGLNADSKWKQLATVDDTGWIDLPLASGITVDGNITPQYRRVNNQVFICGSILGVDSSAKTVAILPVGFRPSRANYYVGFTTGTYTNAIRIDSNGNIIVQSNSSGTYDPTRFATLGTNFII
ncbi:hypothetical protein FDB60_01840 [Clostridium botulinum]|nr:hypothetical protein [Clostridium botulinum]NFL61062.1 hypothetical protein [Clostridium botulinum]